MSLLFLSLILVPSCKKPGSYRLKSKSCLGDLKKEIPKNVKNKLYWESDNYAVSLGINFDEARGTYALASETGQQSNLSVHILSKNRQGEKILYPIKPKIEYLTVNGTHRMKLSDETSLFEMEVSFPNKKIPLYKGDKNAVLNRISLGEFSDNPARGLVNQHTANSRLKGNKYFGKKNPSDWVKLIKKKVASGCSKKTNQLCASLALDTLDGTDSAFSWKMFDFLGQDTVADMNKVGFETNCSKSSGMNICDIVIVASNNKEMKLSEILKLAGMGISPETARILEKVGIQYSDWLDWIAGTLPPSRTNKMAFKISIPEPDSVNKVMSIQLKQTDFKGINKLNLFDIKLDGDKAWLNVTEGTYASSTINYFADKAKLSYKIDNYDSYINGLNDRINRTMLNNKTRFNLDFNSNRPNLHTKDTDIKVSWDANKEYKLQDVFNSFFDVSSDLNTSPTSKGIKIKVPKPEESTEVYFRFRDLPTSDTNVKHRRYIALCGVKLYSDAIEGAFGDYANLLNSAKIVTATTNEAKALKKGINFMVPVYVIKQNLDGSIEYKARLFDNKVNGKVCD